jgi:hypothetical protein
MAVGSKRHFTVSRLGPIAAYRSQPIWKYYSYKIPTFKGQFSPAPAWLLAGQACGRCRKDPETGNFFSTANTGARRAAGLGVAWMLQEERHRSGRGHPCPKCSC